MNAHPDDRLLARFRGSGHSTINSLMAGHDVEIPKNGSKDLCLTWALKGACSSGCKRKDQHVRYSRAVNQKLHDFLDACGVDNVQP